MERSLNAASTATVPPRDLRPLILCGPSVLERDALMRKLWDLLPDSFTIATHHTTNRPIDGQLSLDSRYYISSDEFLNMASSGEFATYGIYEPLRQLMVEWGIARVPEEVEEAELGYSRVPGVYDLILLSENLDEAFQTLVNYIYSSDY
ncbi:Guanylate kinase-like domain-containing protein [Fusarium sp. Ph1]|nr:Guanylate kinase-like domain-containing protein [Fusarium sp. Ph1]